MANIRASPYAFDMMAGVSLSSPGHCDDMQAAAGLEAVSKGVCELERAALAALGGDGTRALVVALHEVEGATPDGAVLNAREAAEKWRAAQVAVAAAAAAGTSRSLLTYREPIVFPPTQFGPEQALPFSCRWGEVYVGPPPCSDAAAAAATAAGAVVASAAAAAHQRVAARGGTAPPPMSWSWEGECIALAFEVAAQASSELGAVHMQRILGNMAASLGPYGAVFLPQGAAPPSTAQNHDPADALLQRSVVHLAASRVVVVPAEAVLPRTLLRGSFGMIFGALALGHVRKAELGMLLPEFECGVLNTRWLVRLAIGIAHGGVGSVSVNTIPALDRFLRTLRWRSSLPPRTQGPADDFAADALGAYNAGRAVHRVVGNHHYAAHWPYVAMGSDKALSDAPTASDPLSVNVPSMGVVNAQGLLAPGADIMGAANTRSPLLLVHLGLNAGDGCVPTALTGTLLGTAIFEGQLHAFAALFCLGGGRQHGRWARAGARLTWHGGGTTSVCRGTTRSMTYYLKSTFDDAAGARKMAEYVGCGSHTSAFTAVHAAQIINYVNQCPNPRHAAALFLLGNLMSDGTMRVARGPNADRLLLEEWDRGGDLHVGFTTTNRVEADMFLRMLRLIGCGSGMPSPGSGGCYNVAASGRMQVGMLLACMEEALEAVVAAAVPIAAAPNPAPPISRVAFAVRALGLHTAQRDSHSIATDPMPGGRSYPLLETILQARKSKAVKKISMVGAVPLAPLTVRTASVVLHRNEHRLFHSLAELAVGAAPQAGLVPPILRVGGAMPEGSRSMELMVASAPARSLAERRAREARARGAVAACAAVGAATLAASSRLPLPVSSPLLAQVCAAINAADVGARAAAPPAARAWRLFRDPAWPGYCLPQDMMALLTGGYGTAAAGVGDPTVWSRNCALRVPSHHDERGRHPATQTCDELLRAYERLRVQFGGSGGRGDGGGQLAAHLAALPALLAALSSTRPRAFSRLFGEYSPRHWPVDRPYLALARAMTGFTAAKLIWGLRGRFSLPLRFSPGLASSLFALFYQAMEIGYGLRSATATTLPNWPMAPTTSLPVSLFGGTGNLWRTSAQTLSRLPGTMVVAVGMVAGAHGST